jgi:hypothetical protein
MLKFNVNRFWNEGKINANSFVCLLIKPLKNKICKILEYEGGGTIKYKIFSTTFRKYLLARNC